MQRCYQVLEQVGVRHRGRHAEGGEDAASLTIAAGSAVGAAVAVLAARPADPARRLVAEELALRERELRIAQREGAAGPDAAGAAIVAVAAGAVIAAEGLVAGERAGAGVH